MKHPFRVLLAVAVLSVMGNSSAKAQVNFLFGDSNYDGNETLTVNLAGGGSVVLNTDGNQGWWSATDSNFPGNQGNTNYIVGNLGGDLLNDFFIFNTSALAGQTAVGATLSVTQFEGLSTTGNTDLTVRFGSVSTPAATLVGTSGTSAAIYNDLGSGAFYASATLPADGVLYSNQVSFALNANAVSDINLAIAGSDGGNFKIGGTLFSNSSVPEPSSFFMAAVGALGVLGYSRFCRRTRTRTA
jgi:hypothetical protein